MPSQTMFTGVLALSLASIAPSIAPAMAAGGALTPAQQSAFQAQCVKKYTAQNSSAAKWAPDQCKEDWKLVTSSLPAADTLIAALPKPGESQPAAALKQKLTMVRWTRAEAPYFATGMLGGLTTHIEGRGTATSLILTWSKTGEMIPYDVAEALRQRGAKLTMVSCEKLGTGEGGRVFTGTMTGSAPFSLDIGQRTAPTGDATSYYGVTLGLTGKQPARGSISGCDF